MRPHRRMCGGSRCHYPHGAAQLVTSNKAVSGTRLQDSKLRGVEALNLLALLLRLRQRLLLRRLLRLLLLRLLRRLLQLLLGGSWAGGCGLAAIWVAEGALSWLGVACRACARDGAASACGTGQNAP